MFEDGPFKGRHWSDIAESNPDYMRGLASSTRAVKKRELIMQHVRWFYPEIEGGGSS
jgi:hypothetical protein